MIHYITKKIDNDYIVWFEQSNRWVQFKEPAWLVNKLYQKGVDNVVISFKIAQKYNLLPQESSRFVNEICSGIAELSKQTTNTRIELNYTYFPSGYSFVPYSIRYYFIRNKCIAIIYETRLAEYYIHPSLAHLETKYSEIVDVQYEIYNHDNISVLMEKDRPETACNFDDFIRLKKRLFIFITNYIYNKTDNDWMSFVHASALTDGKQTILLSSASGSGKSTMSALLQTKGLQFVSDDFVPIDIKSKLVFPFPAAISIKEGAFDFLSPYYGNLREKSFNKYEYTNKSIRYITPKVSGFDYYKAKPVKSILFIRYNQHVACNFNQVPTNEALKLFHEQAWVSGIPEHAKAFINWFVKLRCFNLEYGNSEQGISKILNLFDK